MNDKHCLNCDNEITATQKFCSQCGQTTHVHRFTLTHFFHEVFHAFTHADKGIFFLIKELFLRPGIVAKEYIAGKRKKYFNPFTFFLILAALFVFSNGLISSSSENHEKTIPEQITRISNPAQKEKALAQYNRAIKTRDFSAKHGNVIAMIAVPFFAFFFWVIFYRRNYNYSEHLVANLMFVGFSNLAFTLIVFPLQATFKNTPWEGLMPTIGLILQIIYFAYAYKGFMQLKGFGASLKIFLLSFVGILLWVLITVFAFAFYVYQNADFMDYLKHMGGR